jgi:hypothetical protein
MSNANSSSRTGKIEFIPFHQPALKDGDYTITLQQTIEADGKIKEEKPFTATRKFSVVGPRFSLNPQDIQAVFPPPGSLGEHSNVLPHIILKRSTLPWERSADGESQDLPWLALLLVDEQDYPDRLIVDQIKRPNSWKLSELIELSGSNPFKVSLPKSSDSKDSKDYNVYFPTVTKKTGDHDEDAVAVIDVPKSLLRQILPSRDDLKWLAHVRQTTDEAGKPQGDEVAVIICNRLPKPGGLSIVHLVSVEERYSDGEFQYQDAQDEDLIRLVSLYSWRFACVSEKHSFTGLLLHLNHPLLFNIEKTQAIIQYLNGNAKIPDELSQAFVEVKHALSQGAEIRDHSQWQIIDRERRYLIGGKDGHLKIYNHSGKLLFEANSQPEKITSGQVPAILSEAFSQNNQRLSRATIKPATVQADSGHWWIADGSNQYFISQENGRLYVYNLDPDRSGTLRLSRLTSDNKTANEAAEHYFVMGCVPLAHAMRQGNRTVSWYHGPLVPGKNTTRSDNLPTFPIRTADQLVRYNPDIGMFDVSYAAAWELGRLLALQNKRFSVDLFNWKRSHAQRLKDAESQLTHLPFATPATSLDMPATVRDWFGRRERLEGVPFNYLVPDENMLPPESIRFFQMDWLWIECLLDGAFSIGRVLASDHHRDRRLKADHLTRPSQRVSGLLLRSDVVVGWPGLLVDGYEIIDNQVDRYADELNNNGTVSADLQQAFRDRGLALPDGSAVSVIETADDDKTGIAWLISDRQTHTSYEVEKQSSRLYIKLHVSRMDRLSKNVLIGLFDGEVKAVDIHQKPETLHFGVSRPDEKHNRYYKELRHPDGTEDPNLIVQIPWKDGLDDAHTNRVIDIEQLTIGKKGDFTSAQFALQMIEGVPRVRFTMKGED